MWGRFGMEREAFHRGEFSIFLFQFPRIFVVTVPSAPSSGPAGHLLPDGEKREIAAASTPQATPGKSAVVFSDAYLAGALESADD